jgi:hypothetical protein
MPINGAKNKYHLQHEEVVSSKPVGQVRQRGPECKEAAFGASCTLSRAEGPIKGATLQGRPCSLPQVSLS